MEWFYRYPNAFILVFVLVFVRCLTFLQEVIKYYQYEITNDYFSQ